MTGENERFRLIETAPEWSHEVFDTCAELSELLERHSYRFARTMPGAPHSYTLKRTWIGEDEFVEALRKMRAVERIEEFFRATGIAGSTPMATNTGRWGRASNTSSLTERSPGRLGRLHRYRPVLPEYGRRRLGGANRSHEILRNMLDCAIA